MIKSEPDGVNVTWRNNLVKWLLLHGDIHARETLDVIYETARRATTWSPLRRGCGRGGLAQQPEPLVRPGSKTSIDCRPHRDTPRLGLQLARKSA